MKARQIRVDKVDASLLLEVANFLEKHEETALFLINNLKNHGPSLTNHHNSGNYKVVRAGDEIVGVYCLTRRGNLIFQEAQEIPSNLIIEDCESEPHPIKGFIGAFTSIERIYKAYKQANDYQPAFYSNEILYRLKLRSEDQNLAHDQRVRLLVPSDFNEWIELSEAFNKESKIPNDLSREQMEKDFTLKTSEKVWWGLFEADQLLSRVALNSNGESVGQVGGVFTPKPFRKKGYSKATMLHMLRDCIGIHNHKKSILFTGEKNAAAQNLYESIGYVRAGRFGLILS